MSIQEFSEQFDTLINAYNQKQDGKQDLLAFSEYEKSVFLTRAQEEIVLAYYSGQNATGSSFEETEDVRRYLSQLVKEDTISKKEEGYKGVSPTSTFFKLPEDLWFITFESATVSSDDCHNGQVLDVVPVTQDEYHKIKRNPFRGANGRRVLRLDLNSNIVEIISKYTITQYYIRYLSRLKPIILINLPDNLTIDGENVKQTCVLHEALHRRILDRAVSTAIASRSTGSAPAQERQQQ